MDKFSFYIKHLQKEQKEILSYYNTTVGLELLQNRIRNKTVIRASVSEYNYRLISILSETSTNEIGIEDEWQDLVMLF